MEQFTPPVLEIFKHRLKTKQETQLSLTNRATRLEVSQGHQTWYHTICEVWFHISVCYRNYVRYYIFDFKCAVTLKTALEFRQGH